MQVTLAFSDHKGKDEVGWELLAAGCDTNKVISVGATALHLAAAAGREGVVPVESCSGKGSGISKKKKKKSKKRLIKCWEGGSSLASTTTHSFKHVLEPAGGLLRGEDNVPFEEEDVFQHTELLGNLTL